MRVKFKCTLADGTAVVGPIRGNGGMLGAACSHLSRERQEKAAEDVLRAAIRCIEKRGAQRRIFEPEPGCCAVYPDECAESDGELVAVPLLETKFEIWRD